MGMRPSDNGWANAVINRLATYEGKPCRICGCSTKMTKSRGCQNGCNAELMRQYKRQYDRVTPRLPKSPERAWNILKPDFTSENLHVQHW